MVTLSQLVVHYIKKTIHHWLNISIKPQILHNNISLNIIFSTFFYNAIMLELLYCWVELFKSNHPSFFYSKPFLDYAHRMVWIFMSGTVQLQQIHIVRLIFEFLISIWLPVKRLVYLNLSRNKLSTHSRQYCVTLAS